MRGLAGRFRVRRAGEGLREHRDGNVTIIGYGLATDNGALADPTAAEVAGFVVGAAVWAWLLRRRRMALGLLVGELVILLAVLVGWIAASAHPHPAPVRRFARRRRPVWARAVAPSPGRPRPSGSSARYRHRGAPASTCRQSEE
jgi:hypothetical protein